MPSRRRVILSQHKDISNLHQDFLNRRRDMVSLRLDILNQRKDMVNQRLDMAQPAPGYTQPTQGYGQPAPGYVQQTPGYAQPAPGYAPPGGYNYTPPTAPSLLPPPGGISAAPGVTGGGVQPPAAWDPYATPGPSTTPSPLLPQDPYFQYGQPAVPAMAMTKALQEVRLDYHWFAGHGDGELGINDVELSAKFAIPFLLQCRDAAVDNAGFCRALLGRSCIVIPGPPPPADLPARTYDAYLDAAWNPQLLPWLGGELSFRAGLYDDFNRKVTTDTFRFTGTGLGVVSLSPNVKVKAGVMYLDRVYIKLLPSGGIVWTPNPDVYFNILFPNPKIARRLDQLWQHGVVGIFLGRLRRRILAHYPGQRCLLQPSPATTTTSITTISALPSAWNSKHIATSAACSRWAVHSPANCSIEASLPQTYFPTNTVFLRGGLAY